MKEKYIEFSKNKFSGEALELILKQIDLFYKEENINTNKYTVGENVLLKKGTFLHGIYGGLENFDYVINNGFISSNFTGENRYNKMCNGVGMWNIQQDCMLRDYILNYSGITISYTIGRGPTSTLEYMLVPYHQFDKVVEELQERDDVWQYFGEQTKEVRFLPSLVAPKRQIAFILNMESDYAKELKYNDIFNLNISDLAVKSFTDYRYYDKFLLDRKNRTPLTTNRESHIIFGLPSRLIEGVLVGREVEKDEETLNYIKSKLKDCYICNLDGKVIIGNKE